MAVAVGVVVPVVGRCRRNGGWVGWVVAVVVQQHQVLVGVLVHACCGCLVVHGLVRKSVVSLVVRGRALAAGFE